MDLNIEEETLLKKEILRQILHKEIEILKADPGLDTLDKKTILVRFLYSKFVFEFPFLKNNSERFWNDVDAFIKKIHSCNLSTSMERGKLTEVDIWTHRLEKVGVILFKNHFLTNAVSSKESPDKSVAEENLKEEEDKMTPAYLSPLTSPLSEKWKPKDPIDKEENNLSEEYLKIFKDFINKLLYSGEVLNLFELIKSVDKVEDLPNNYIVLLNGSYRVMAFYLFKKYHKGESAEKSKAYLKTMHSLFPFFALKALLKFSNPIRIVRGMVDLFLAKPFGNKNLAQQFVGIWMEAHYKDQEEEEGANENSKNKGKKYYLMSRKKLIQLISNSAVVEKVINYVNRNDSVREIEEFPKSSNYAEKITYILKSPSISPTISNDIIDSFSSEKLMMIYQFYRKEVRIRDYTQVKKLLSDDGIIHTIKETVSTFSEPLMKLYKQADVGVVIDMVKQLIGECIQLQSTWSSRQSKGEIKEINLNNSEISSEDQMIFQEYAEILQKFCKGLYKFFHETSKKDDGLIQSLICWFVEQMEFFQKDPTIKSKPMVDLKSILEANINTNEKRKSLLDELKQLKIFHDERNQRISHEVKMMMNEGLISKNSYEGFFDKYVSNEELEDINFGDSEILQPPLCPTISSLTDPFTKVIESTIEIHPS